MNDTTKRDDEHHPVRKLLQTLPKIPAREDFIERLHRRLAEKPQKKTLWSSLEISPIPAYSLSVIALVIAGAVFYFSFIRTERGSVEYKTKQADFQREEPPPQTTAQPPQTTQGSQTAGGNLLLLCANLYRMSRDRCCSERSVGRVFVRSNLPTLLLFSVRRRASPLRYWIRSLEPIL